MLVSEGRIVEKHSGHMHSSGCTEGKAQICVRTMDIHGEAAKQEMNIYSSLLGPQTEYHKQVH
jgi:hypothetical protein